MIYLDNAASTRMHPEVLEAMLPFLTDSFGNAGSSHSIGRAAKEAVQKAREQVADFFSCEGESHILFTSSGSEANSLAILGSRVRLYDTPWRNMIVTTAIEHDSVLRSVKLLQNVDRFPTVYIKPMPEGNISADQMIGKIDPETTGLVSCMYVNNETGVINDIEAICSYCADNGVVSHVDAVQASGTIPLNPWRIRCDMMSISAHKIGGPKGIGALYVRDKSILSPIICGGSDQEYGLRGGSENVASIVGFGKACELTKARLYEDDLRASVLKQLFFTNLMERMKSIGLEKIVTVNGNSITAHGKILNLRFSGIDGETLLVMLDSLGVCVSAGSACNSKEHVPSHVLLAMGLSEEDARDSIRISFSASNTEAEIDAAANAFATCIQCIRAMQ